MTEPQTEARRTFYLIDGSAYIYRAYFALPPLSNSKGVQTNAVYGFTNMLLKVIREHRPDCLAVVFDEKGPTARHIEFKEYKAQRPEMPRGMQVQIPLIHRVVETFGVPVVRRAGYEADDLIGTLARKAETAGCAVVIVTSDKDMFQLLTPATRIYDPVKDKWYGEKECRERFGVEPARVVEIMGLMGDAIDNIPGVKGIGEKTAVKLIQQFGTVEEVLRRVDELPPKIRTLLIEQAETARLSRRLAMIQVDCPIEFDCDKYRVVPPAPEPLVALLRELEFHTLLKLVQPASAAERLGTDFKIVRDEAEVLQFANACQQSVPSVALALHGVLKGAAEVRAGLEGVALSTSEKTIFLPATGNVVQLPPPIMSLLESGDRVKAAHDVKAVLLALGRTGLKWTPPWFDTMVAAYLLNPNRRTYTLESVALDILGYHVGVQRIDEAERVPADLFERADSSSAAGAAEAAAVVARLVPILKARLEEQGSYRLFNEVEMPLVPVLAEIERNGFCLDVSVLEKLGKELELEMDRLAETITRLAGESFNFNSPRQLASVLFEKLGLKPLRKTKTGYSTDEETLTQLAVQHELPAQILAYRNLSKLKSTYVDALPTLVNPETGRVHTSLNQTVAATGRLSSTEPNLQNIPVKGEYGLRIREAFVAAPGHMLLAADYSQIEPRILAHLSQDKRLLSVFERGEDIHTATAVDIFNLAPDQITRDMRRVAKTVVFGILYGISPYGLSQTLGISQQKAREYIDAYFARYAGVKAFLDRTLEEAKQNGYVTTILGRRRPIPELSSPDATQRSFGERMAINNPIQGSAADLIKAAMIAVHRRLKAELPAVKMILQIHDELIFETPKSDLTKTEQLVRSEMTETGSRLGISVPLKVDVSAGANWREARP